MMGLGRTIELLGGAFLREILHAHHQSLSGKEPHYYNRPSK